MPVKFAVRTSILVLAVALAGPAWAQQTAKPAMAACPTVGTFADPSACECPPGFGKILHGNGGGECKPRACPVGSQVDPKLCDCPTGYVEKPGKKGKVTCVLPKPKA